MWISKDDYTSRYGEIDDATFNRLGSEAQAMIDNLTTGIDGVHKLREYMPTDEYDLVAVKSCMCKVINMCVEQEKAEQARTKIIEREDGTVISGVVKSVSSGSESVSYGDIGKASQSGVEALTDAMGTIASTIRWRLGLVKDANGINLLYMGVYPRV